jgi:exoribonuclease-2
MFLEGQIIEFLDADELKPGYVRKQERDRLHVIDPRGRNLSMNGDRVAIVHRQSTEADFPAMARGILERVQARRTEVDVHFLWECLGGSPRQFLPAELAELFFGESSPEAASAVFRALSEDTLYFKRDGVSFLPKTPAQVNTEQTKRTRQREREGARAAIADALTQLVGNSGEITAEMSPLLDRIQSWLRNGTNDEVAVALEKIAGSSRARDTAYDILLRAGRLDPLGDRFLVTAGIEEQFPAAVVEAARAAHPVIHAPGRADYREAPALTIDDEDTLEVDDALTLRQENNELLVGIHIADVSAFVQKDDPLDVEAAKRSSTIYLPNVAVRMLPEELSTDLCSLRQDVERPTFTVEVRFDSSFNRLGYRIVLGTIRVHRRLSYDEADEQIRRGDASIATLHQIALHLQQKRAESGAITFRRPELKVHIHDGKIHLAKLDSNAPSRILVSEMMILANSLSADFAAANSLPVIFRTQEPREALPPGEAPASEALAFEQLRRTFKRSRLSLSPGLHSGLGLTAYTQASSPIRRYADLITQRQFTAFLRGEAVPHSREELLNVLAAAEAAETEIRNLEERSNTYWLLEHVSRERMGHSLAAVVLDRKGTAELQDYYLKGRLVDPGTAAPGDTIQVTIERMDSLRGDLRLKRV